MNKKLYIFLVGVVFSISISSNVALLDKTIMQYANAPIKVCINSPKNNLGRVGCDIASNGEQLVIQRFIKKDDVVIDAGANVGDWTKSVLAAIGASCTIYSFEPMPAPYATLEQLKKQYSNVVMLNNALGREEATLEMYSFFNKDSGLSTFYNRPVLSDRPYRKIKVPVISLDKFVQDHGISHIDFLKIDTEGAELDILLGAQNSIRNNMIDSIQFEYGGTYSDAHITLLEVYNYLTAHGYLIFKIVSDGLIHIPEWDERLEDFQYSNYLALRKVAE